MMQWMPSLSARSRWTARRTATVAVGTLANKIEVFDASGASLGFVPVYASIT